MESVGTPIPTWIGKQKLLLYCRRTYKHMVTWSLTRKAIKGVEQRGDRLRTELYISSGSHI